MKYLTYVYNNPYLVATCVFAVVALASFVSGHPFTGVLAIAGGALAGGRLLAGAPTPPADKP